MNQKTKKRTTGSGRRRGCAAMAGALLAGLAPSGALARGNIPVLLQVTNITTGTVHDPRVRSQYGDSLAFTSDGDVAGPSPGHNEVYLYDFVTAQTQRLTTTAGGESREAARPSDTVGAGGRPELVAFISTGNLDPSVGNLDGNPEVFLWIKDTNTIRQLTNTGPGVVNSDVYSSDSGKCIVFSSTGNLDNNVGSDSTVPPTGYTNPDGSTEVFLYSVDSGMNYPDLGFFTQVSNGPAGTSSTRPVVGGYIFQRQCQTTAYMSDHDQTGDTMNPGRTNIYVYDRNSARTDWMFTGELKWGIQPGDYLYPHISSASPFARGPYVVFHTDADHWRNGSSGNEVFRFRAFHPRMTQYTDYEFGSVERPVISDGGGYVAFQSDAEVLDAGRRAKLGGEPPFNDDANYEIFRIKGRRKVWQITRSQGCTNDQPSMRDDATTIVFRSDCDLVPGRNPGGLKQVFAWKEVFPGDPLATAEGCSVAAGCCNEANGCYQPIYGRKPIPRSKGCIDKGSGCETLQQ